MEAAGLRTSLLITISTSSSPENSIWGSQEPLQDNVGECREILGFLFKKIEMPSKRPIQRTPGNSF